MVIKNLENKIKLVLIICSLFLMGCVIISISSIWTASVMVTDAQQKVYVLDGNVPILVQRSTMEETLDVEAKSHIEMFHHFFFTLAPDDKYIKYSIYINTQKKGRLCQKHHWNAPNYSTRRRTQRISLRQ